MKWIKTGNFASVKPVENSSRKRQKSIDFLLFFCYNIGIGGKGKLRKRKEIV